MRFLRVLHRELWMRRLPHGLVSPQFLWSRDLKIRVHRTLFLGAKPGWPKLLYFLVEAVLWIKWLGLYGWMALFRAMKKLGGRTRDEFGVSLAQQFVRLLRTTFWVCLPPVDAYRFGIIARPETLWDYVSDLHIGPYHAWRNSLVEPVPASISNLSDKLETANALQQQGIAVVATIASSSINSKSDLIELLHSHKRLFCKARSGSSGTGAFECVLENETIIGKQFEKHQQLDEMEVLKAWDNLLGLGEAMVQPLLENHPVLAPLAPNGMAITVRCITQQMPYRVDVICSTLEVPANRGAKGDRRAYNILPIDVERGTVAPMPSGLTTNTDLVRANSEILGLLKTNEGLPGWSNLIEQSKLAHSLFPGHWAIAWDWVLTPDGPVLLEGNRSFGGTMPQILAGGFLSDL